MSTSTTTTLQPRFAGLDGLRAIAVSLVIVYHLTPGALGGGFIGVDVFFVISGFLITSLLVRDGNLRIFYVRRARRLLPALALVVLVCTTAALAIGGDVLVGLGSQVLGAATFSYNWLALAGGADYFSETTPELFRNLWSLAVEEQFYLVWPLLLLALLAIKSARIRIVLIVALAVASAATMFLLSDNATRVYYGTDTHSFGLALGAALAMLPRRSSRALQVVGALAIVGLVAVAALIPTASPVALVLVAVLTALAIAASVSVDSVLGRALDIAPLRWIGERSYGLYLWHWPVVILVTAGLPAVRSTPNGEWMLGAIALVITVVAAALSYRWLEQPVRRRGFRACARGLLVALRSGRPAAVGGWLGVAASIVLVALTATAIVAAPQAGEAQSRIEAGQESLADPEPVAVSLPSGKDITAVGDSVMLAAAPELTKAFPGILIDAVVSRQMADGPRVIRDLVAAGKMRSTLVLGLGTNGPLSGSTVLEIRKIIGPQTRLVIVNFFAPRDWIDRNNLIVEGYARRERSVELANWNAAIEPHADVLSSDNIHPGGPKGGRIYARAIRDALQRLAELPPRLDNNDYVNSDRPV